jgi:multidrug resistance protein
LEEEINIKPVVFVLFMTIFIIGADTFIISPLVPTISKYFTVNASEAGLLVTAYSIGYAIFAFVFGPISDKIGRRFLLIAGLICFSVFGILCGFANDFKVLFLLRILSGVAASAAAPQVWASIGDLIPFEKRGRVMGIVSAALAVSQLLGVPIGAFIADAGGWRSSFFALGITSIIVVLLAIIYFPKTRNKASNDSDISSQLLTSLKSVLFNKHALSGLFVTLFLMFGSFGMYSFLGVWLSDSFKLTVNAIGSVIIFVGIGNLIGNLTGGLLADTFGKKIVAIMGMFSLSILLILLPYTSHNFILAIGCILLWFISAGISLSSLNSLLVGLVPSLRGTMMSLNSSFMYIGTTIGVTFNGIILNDFGFHSVGLSSGISVLISVILISVLVSLKKDKASASN